MCAIVADGPERKSLQPLDAGSLAILLAEVIASIACRGQYHLLWTLSPYVGTVTLDRQQALEQITPQAQAFYDRARVIVSPKAGGYWLRIEEFQVDIVRAPGR